MKKTSQKLAEPVVMFFLLFLISACAAAQEINDSDPELPGIQQHVAPVKVDGKILFSVRGISYYTAEQRAAAISNRISEAAADPKISSDSLKIVVDTDHSSIYAGTRFLMQVYDADADVEQVTRETLAMVIRQNIADAIELYRINRSRPVLIKRSINALGALVLLAVILLLIFWLYRSISKGLEHRFKTRVDTLENKSFSLIQANQLWKIYHLLARVLKIIITVLLITFTINYILGLFPWTNNVANYLLKLLVDPVVSIGQSFLRFLPDLVFLVAIYLVTRYLIKLSKLLFIGLSDGKMTIKGFDAEWAMPSFRIFRIFVIIFAVIVAYPYIPGSGTSAFKGISVFIGVLFSLGSSSFISNLIAGYTMTYRGAFKKGDLIQVGDKSGYVEEKAVLDTRLLSIQNEEIIIPNSVLLNSNIINYTTKAKASSLIIHTSVGIGYETPWRLVDAMLKLAADRTEGLLKHPSPFVLKRSLSDFAINYEINAYSDDASRMHFIYTALHQNILDVFNENNVQIMTPAYMHDPAIPKVVPKDQWNTPLASETEEKT